MQKKRKKRRERKNFLTRESFQRRKKERKKERGKALLQLPVQTTAPWKRSSIRSNYFETSIGPVLLTISSMADKSGLSALCIDIVTFDRVTLARWGSWSIFEDRRRSWKRASGRVLPRDPNFFVPRYTSPVCRIRWSRFWESDKIDIANKGEKYKISLGR